MAPLFMAPMISAPAVAAFICSKHGASYNAGSSTQFFSITQDSAVLSSLKPEDIVEFHLLRRSLVYRAQSLLLSAAGQKFSVTDGEKSRNTSRNHVTYLHPTNKFQLHCMFSRLT
jgi:hypothetical protein